MLSCPLYGVPLASTVGALACLLGGTTPCSYGARSEINDAFGNHLSLPWEIPVTAHSLIQPSMASLSGIVHIGAGSQVNEKLPKMVDAKLVAQKLGTTIGTLCRRDVKGQTLGCDVGCRCTPARRCYPKYEVFDSNGNLASVGICEVSTGVLAVISVVSCLTALFCIVALRTYLRTSEYEQVEPYSDLRSIKPLYRRSVTISGNANDDIAPAPH